MTGRRIVSIFLPQFPMERWQKMQERAGNVQPEELPQILAIEGTHGPVIHAANRAAYLAGVTKGARVVDMRALCPSLRVDYADPQGDRLALEKLSLWARRWCPWSATDGQGLILDTTGSDHLWDGEAKMLAEMEGRLSLLGFSSSLALAPTWGAAWALARFGPVRAICVDPAPLPVAALRLEDETVLLLNRLGLKTIGALTAVPRLSLARRFSRAPLAQNPLLRLDQLTGHLPEPLAPPEAQPVFRVDARLAEPIFDPTHHLPGLCEALCVQLTKAGQGARRLQLSVYRTDGEVSRIEAATVSPSRDSGHLAFLFRDRLEKINPGFGFDLISLEATVIESMMVVQTTLSGETDTALDLSHLVDRLTARFGAQSFSRLHTRQSHVPERAAIRAAPLAEPGGVTLMTAERPIRLLTPPEEVRVTFVAPEGPPAQFLWRRQTHRIARYQGPERIAPEWWKDRPGTRLRDYFKVEDSAGRRYWLYRDGLNNDGRGDAPRWFVHGMFA